MKAFVLTLALSLACVLFSGKATAGEGFELAKPVVNALSAGTYHVKYRNNPANFVPVTVYNVKGGMVVTYLEMQAHVRRLSRDGDLYVIDDKIQIMEVYQGRAVVPLMFGRGPYTFAGKGEKVMEGKALRYEEAVADDGVTLRFFFEDSKSLFSRSPVLSVIEAIRPEGKGRALFFITGFTSLVQDKQFEVPKEYTVRKTLQQLREDADKGKMPDDPVDKMLLDIGKTNPKEKK